MDPDHDTLERFAYLAAHDLKEPLRGMQSLAEWIEEDAGEALPAESRAHLTKLRALGQRAQALLDDLLDYTRLGFQEVAREELDPAPLVRSAAEALGVRVEVDDLPAVHGSPVLVERIARALVGNAYKHHDRAEPRVRVRALEDGARRGLAFEDDGPGIPSEHRERVFRPLETLRPRDEVEGSGMGLAFARRAARVLGGDVELLASDGRGSTFVLWLPRGS